MDASTAPAVSRAVAQLPSLPDEHDPRRRPAGPAAARDTASHALSITEFLAFKLGSEEYGIDILRVQEIRSFEKPTHIANAPDHILGVVNLRGMIVPIVDLRLQFRLAGVAYDGFTVTIVVGIAGKVVGVVVDAVSDVVTLSPDQIRPMPALHSSIDSDHLLAIGAIDERMLVLMDIEKLLSSTATGLVDGTGH